ncbi:MAG: flagellar M-ring protein FliF [Verrucomicrobiota bacterium]|jgi:flagellar M-ring protein FliF
MNKSLSQLGQQLLAAWRQLGLNQRISVGLAFIVVLGVLCSLAIWSGRVDYALLYGKLDDTEAAKVIAFLDETKVPHKIGQGGAAIYVPRDKVHVARLQLAAKGVPRGDGVGFEIFDKPNFGISDFVQRANYLRAIQGELARTISQLDEIEAARVMIVMPENRLLVDNHKRATASVFVKVKGNGQLAPSAVNSIRFLVANSVEGLQAGQVILVDNRGNVLSENSDSDSLVGLTASQLSARRSLEQYLARKAEGMLEAVLGPGQAVVRVSAEINLDSLTRTEERYDPDGQVLRISTINDESTDTTGAASGGGAPGVTANIGETNVASGASGSNSRNKKKVTNNQYEINRTTSNMTQLSGGLKRVSAAVFVAARHEGLGTERKMMPRTPEELEKLRHIVQSAVGIQAGDPTRRDEITLEEMPFSEPLAEVAQDIGKQEKRQFWWNQVQNLVYPVLALVVFVIFWRALRRTSAAPVSDGIPIESQPVPVTGTSRSHGQKADVTEWQQRDVDVPGVVSVDVFNKIVRENPDNVTQAIQSWLARSNSIPR